uniref:IBB domain-containing protein n=1 Tax=Onchocerca volvulus TaxID=6282 RepID=A0A8R1TT11_ONCVO
MEETKIKEMEMRAKSSANLPVEDSGHEQTNTIDLHIQNKRNNRRFLANRVKRLEEGKIKEATRNS